MRATVCRVLRVALGSHPACAASGSAFEYVPPVPTIVLNGEPQTIADGQTVAELLQQLGLDSRQVAVERNRDIVPRAEHGRTVLAEGDQLEVVTFVGGG